MSQELKTTLLKFAFPLVTATIICFMRETYFKEFLTQSSPFFLLPLIVILHAFVGDVTSGIFAGLYYILLSVYFFTPPYHSFDIETSYIRDINISLISAIIIAFFIGRFASNRRKLKALTKSLDENSERLRNVIDSIFNIIVIVDRHGNIVEANKTYADLQPGSWNDIEKKNIFDVNPWVSDRKIKSNLRRALRDVTYTSPIKYEEFLTLDNHPMYVEISITVIDPEPYWIDDSTNIVITVKDITDKHLYESEIEKKNSLFSKMIDSNVIGMIIGDDKGEVLETNNAFLKMLGYTPLEFQENGLNCLAITPVEFHEREAKSIEEIYKVGYAATIEKEFIRKDGSKVPVLVSGILLNASEKTILCLIVDLTLQKNSQKKIGEFISIASHELKTPMTIIKGYLQILNRKLTDNKTDYTGFLNTIDFQLNKMNTLVNELHKMSRLESNKLTLDIQDLNINQLVQDSINAAKPFTDKHEFEFIQNGKSIIVEADPIRLEQVIINLLTNAIKYSKNGDINKIIVTVGKDKKMATVSVQDFGIGIPATQLEDIFTKFFQVEQNREVREGLGLGLYISSEIIKKHGGIISVESEEGKGSTFKFTIPLKKVNKLFTIPL